MRRRRTFAEWRTIAANRLFGGTRMLGWISAAKWAVYPLVVRTAPWLAMAMHEPESTRAYWKAIEPGMVVVDAGSNMGGYALLAARRTGAAGRVFAFEPEPANFARLRARMRKHANVTPVQKAVSAASGQAVLRLDSFHAGHSLVSAAAVAGSVTVPVTSLDDFVRDEALPGIDVVKLDVEGVELLALDGMQRLLGGARPPTILCEVHPPIAPEEVIAKLAPFGYRCRLLDAELSGAAHSVPVHVLGLPPERARA